MINELNQYFNKFGIELNDYEEYNVWFEDYHKMVNIYFTDTQKRKWEADISVDCNDDLADVLRFKQLNFYE